MAISEFWCSGRQLGAKLIALLLHTNRFRKTGSLVFKTKLCYMSSCSTSPFNKGPDNFMDLADMLFQLFLSRTILTGEHRTFPPDGAAPDIPEALSGDINGLPGAGYHDPL